MLFRKTVAVYCQNQTEPTKALCGGKFPRVLNIKFGGIFSYRSAFRR